MQFFCFGPYNRTEALRVRVEADGERYAVSQRVPCLYRSEPMRLGWFPVDEIEIGILRMHRRRTLQTLFV